jgi:septum site-determining protein MinC
MAVPDVPMHVRVDQTVPVIVIPEHLGFEDLRAWVREQMPRQADLIGGRASRLDLGGRELKLFDLRRLIHLLREEFGVEITGLYVGPEAVQRYAERELKLKLFLLDDPAVEAPDEVDTELASDDLDDEAPEEGELAEVPQDEQSHDEDGSDDDLPSAEKVAATTLPNDLGDLSDLDSVSPREITATPAPTPARDEPRVRTMPVYRTLRSGASVRFDGDIIVYGDVNPGAHVVATGNITVLGAMKGMAHAGAGGDEDAFIFALLLRPTQLRIARKIAVPPDRDRDSVPERARVEGEQIVIETFAPRSRS